MINVVVFLRTMLTRSLATGLLAFLSAAHVQAEDQPTKPPIAMSEERPKIRSVFAAGAVSSVELGGQGQTWSLVSGGATFNSRPAGVTAVDVQRTSRPAVTNWRMALRHDEQLSENTGLHLELSASTGDPLREDWGVGGGIVQRLSAQVQLTFDARAARYSTPDPAAPRNSFVGLAARPGVIVTPSGTPLEVAVQAIVLRNEQKKWQAGGAVRALYYIGDRDFFIAGASRYPENELGRVLQLTSIYAGARHEIGHSIGLRGMVEYSSLENAWKSTTISIGLEKRF